MTTERRVLVHPDKPSLAGSVAARFLTKLIDLLDDQGVANIGLTGGTMGEAVLQAIAESPARDSVDWSRVTFWFSDERYLPKGDPERNETQARAALLDALPLEDEQVRAMPAVGEHPSIEDAAAAYEAELIEAGLGGAALPHLDILFLGVGPDGHIASLFPDHTANLHERERLVVTESDSPKPPPLRLSFTLPVINSADRIWLVLAGADKAGALGLALAGASVEDVPAAGAEGRKRTVFFVDREAAAEVPEALITPEQYWTSAHDLP